MANLLFFIEWDIPNGCQMGPSSTYLRCEAFISVESMSEINAVKGKCTKMFEQSTKGPLKLTRRITHKAYFPELT